MLSLGSRVEIKRSLDRGVITDSKVNKSWSEKKWQVRYDNGQHWWHWDSELEEYK